MKLYLAGRYSQKDEISVYARDLEKRGAIVTSSWLQEPHNPNTNLHDVSDDLLEKYQKVDLDDIRRADGMVFFSQPPTVPTLRGGRHVEFGYALALGKPILVYGPKENIFHYNWRVTNVETWEDVLESLGL